MGLWKQQQSELDYMWQGVIHVARCHTCGKVSYMWQGVVVLLVRMASSLTCPLLGSNQGPLTKGPLTRQTFSTRHGKAFLRLFVSKWTFLKTALFSSQCKHTTHTFVTMMVYYMFSLEPDRYISAGRYYRPILGIFRSIGIGIYNGR